jgi:hypothetical protein
LIADGIVMLHARFLTKTGVRDSFDVPVLIRDGQVLQPSVIMHEGRMKVLAPSSVKEMVARGTFVQEAPPRGLFSGPMTHAEIGQWNQIERDSRTTERMNPGMFSVSSSANLLRAAVRGDVAFRQAQLGEQPSRAAMGLKATPAARVGDRIVTQLTWDVDATEAMGDHNLQHALKSYVLELGTKKEWRDWGTIADVQIDEFDRDAGTARASFKSSEISAPQLSGADFDDLTKNAAIGPSQDETDLQPAEREQGDRFHIGDTVKLTKGQLLRNRGGGTDTVTKGTKGQVVGDMFGDGLTLKIVFEDVSSEPMIIPASHVKKASTVTAEKIVQEIENLRRGGYSPIDVIPTVRQRYGLLGETALKQAKAKGLLDW